MKRMLTAMLALLMLLSLVACGEPEENGNQDQNHGNDPTTSSQPEEVEMKTIYVLVSETVYDIVDGQLAVSTVTANTYDENGLLLERTYDYGEGNVSTYTAENDEHGRVTCLTFVSDGQTVTIEYTYDSQGNLASETRMADGKVVYAQNCTYNDNGNLLTLEYQYTNGSIDRYVYIYEDGRVVQQEIYGDGVLTQINKYHYDEQGRLTSLDMYTEKGTILATNVTTYSEDGLTITDYCERWKIGTITTKDAHGNTLRIEALDASGVYKVKECVYQAIEIPADYPRKN